MPIPLLFLDGEPNPECKWVFDGEGEAHHLWVGESCAVIGGTLHKRSERGNWIPVSINDAGHCEAWAKLKLSGKAPDGGYELCGPGIKDNPHEFQGPTLVRHKMAVIVNLPRLNLPELRQFIVESKVFGYLGLVWHHPDGRMAKLRVEDVEVHA